MLRRSILSLIFSLSLVAPASAQQWAEKMFEVHRHDFGSVARGAKAEFEFELSNPYLEDVHIESVRSTCGCTTPRIKKALLKTYEKGAIVAKINTDRFLGRKGATITVVFDKPFFAEVQLHVTTYIRSDVVFHPGEVNLGSVDQGKGSFKKIQVHYAGRDDWEILEVRSANPHLSGEVVETSRGNGQVTYELMVNLDEEAPVGYLKDHLLLLTNDHRLTQVPVPVEGRIVSGLTVSPASLFLGVVKPGEKVTKQLVVRGSRPFRITSISCDAEGFEFDTSGEEVPKPLHLIPVTFVAGDHPGRIIKTIRIETDLGESLSELPAFAVVAANDTKP